MERRASIKALPEEQDEATFAELINASAKEEMMKFNSYTLERLSTMTERAKKLSELFQNPHAASS